MDRAVIDRKLESLRRCLARVATQRPQSVAALEANLDMQDVLVLNLTRAVQICVDLGAHLISNQALPAPGTMGETFDRLAQAGIIDGDLAATMKGAVGFRNVAVHAYDTIDWRIVFAIATKHQIDFQRYARAISAKAGT